MIRVRIDVSREMPLPDIAPAEPQAEDGDVIAAISRMQFGPPVESIAHVDARMPDLEAAHVLMSNTAMALAQYSRRVDEATSKGWEST